MIFAIPGIVGAAAGSALGKILNGKELLFIFAILMLIVAGIMVRNAGRQGSDPSSGTAMPHSRPSPAKQAEEEAAAGFFGWRVIRTIVFVRDDHD